MASKKSKSRKLRSGVITVGKVQGKLKESDVSYRLVGRYSQAAKNFLEGMGTAVDIAAARPRRAAFFRSDAAALQSDWKAVGRDIAASTQAVMGKAARTVTRESGTIHGREAVKPTAKGRVRFVRLSKRGSTRRGN